MVDHANRPRRRPRARSRMADRIEDEDEDEDDRLPSNVRMRRSATDNLGMHPSARHGASIRLSKPLV